MPGDAERLDRIRQALREEGLDVLACSLPAHVLLLTGYWPVVGTAIALAARDGRVVLVAPEDERDLAARAGVEELFTFRPGSLDALTDAEEAVRKPLREAAARLGVRDGRIGFEPGGTFEPSSYAAMHLYGAAIVDLLGEAFPKATPVPAGDLLARLCSVKTAREVGRVRGACRIVAEAFADGTRQLAAGFRETEVAARYRTPLSVLGTGRDGVERAGGFAFCMAGANAAQAFGAYARSRSRPVARGECVLVHVNSYADGYWTDVTRTYCLGGPPERQQKMYSAILAARAAALEAIRPGARAADVDGAARDVLAARGLGREFKHATGHGVGFAAINHNARPRLHPRSDDVLRPGMVFNVEPAVYLEGYGGLRHCDVVTVTETGCELLTPFQSRVAELVLP